MFSELVDMSARLPGHGAIAQPPSTHDVDDSVNASTLDTSGVVAAVGRALPASTWMDTPEVVVAQQHPTQPAACSVVCSAGANADSKDSAAHAVEPGSEAAAIAAHPVSAVGVVPTTLPAAHVRATVASLSAARADCAALLRELAARGQDNDVLAQARLLRAAMAHEAHRLLELCTDGEPRDSTALASPPSAVSSTALTNVLGATSSSRTNPLSVTVTVGDGSEITPRDVHLDLSALIDGLSTQLARAVARKLKDAVDDDEQGPT